VNGKITLDVSTKVAYNSTYDGYFRVGYRDETSLQLLPTYNYIVKYEPINRILNFTGTVTEDGLVHEALIGIAAYNNSTGNAEIVFTDFYANLKLQLPPTTTRSSTLQSSDKVADVRQCLDMIRQSIKPVVRNNPTNDNVVMDQLDQTGLQKISVKDMKVY
jgi:hypothetical protein